MLPTLHTSFQQGGVNGVALLGPGGSDPDVPVQGIELSVGLQIHLCEKDGDEDGRHGYLHVDGVVAGWNNDYQCWFATYDWDQLKWTPEIEAQDHIISFDEWVRRVFAHQLIDHDWWWREDMDWNELEPVTSIEYLTRLFEEGGTLLSTYSDAQVDQGLWLLIGCGSDHARELARLSLSWSLRLRCARSILCLFEMFSTRCSQHLSHLDEPGANPLNSICYMFWDILPISGSPSEPKFADLDRSLLSVMKETLAFSSDACKESALHGLGHWQDSYPGEVEQIVDEFIAGNPTMRSELRLYAERARSGHVL